MKKSVLTSNAKHIYILICEASEWVILCAEGIFEDDMKLKTLRRLMIVDLNGAF